jgi:pilus assembly protein Flp/PilA
MKTIFSRFVKDESGATAIEYGLIAAGISVAIIAVVQGLGTKLNTTFSSVSGALKYASFSPMLREGSGRSPGPFRFVAQPCRGAAPLTRSQPARRKSVSERYRTAMPC